MAEEKNKRVKVTLAKPHTHGGVQYKEGDVIEVTEAQAARLEKVGGVAKPAAMKIEEKKGKEGK